MLTTHNINRLIGVGAAAAALLMATPAFSQSSLSAGTSGSAGLSGIKGAPGAASGSATTDLETRGGSSVGAGTGVRLGTGSGSASISGGASASNNSSTNVEHVEPDLTLRNNSNVSRAGVEAAQQQSTEIQSNEPSGGNE